VGANFHALHLSPRWGRDSLEFKPQRFVALAEDGSEILTVPQDNGAMYAAVSTLPLPYVLFLFCGRHSFDGLCSGHLVRLSVQERSSVRLSSLLWLHTFCRVTGLSRPRNPGKPMKPQGQGSWAC